MSNLLALTSIVLSQLSPINLSNSLNSIDHKKTKYKFEEAFVRMTTMLPVRTHLTVKNELAVGAESILNREQRGMFAE